MIISFLSLFLSISDLGLIFLSLLSQIRVSLLSLSFGLRFGFVVFLMLFGFNLRFGFVVFLMLFGFNLRFGFVVFLVLFDFTSFGLWL